MNYWCLNPGVTFNELVNHKPVSIFLTVIDAHKQLFVRVCKRSQNKTPFNFNFETRNNSSLIRDLASTIINMLAVVPGGVLVFFPSYHLMDTYIRQWQTDKFDGNTSFYEKIESRKAVCIEVLAD